MGQLLSANKHGAAFICVQTELKSDPKTSYPARPGKKDMITPKSPYHDYRSTDLIDRSYPEFPYLKLCKYPHLLLNKKAAEKQVVKGTTPTNETLAVLDTLEIKATTETLCDRCD